MRILIDIGHPGHVHYFKNIINYFKNHRHDVLVVAREREVISALLKKLNIEFINRGSGANSKIGKVLYMFKADLQMLILSLKFKPDLFLSFTSPYPAHISFLFRRPHIAINDTEHVDKLNSKLTYPYCSCIITPDSYLNDLGEKQIRFKSVVEGLYLHKEFFKPDVDIKKALHIKDNEEYILMRFVSWNAHHDVGHSGIDLETKRKLIALLKLKYKIFISSENELPEEFNQYKIDIEPSKIHDVLAQATLFIGESATMASESTLLGTEAVYINSLPLMGYLKFEQDSGMLKHFESSAGVLEYVSKKILEPDLKLNSFNKSAHMQRDFINPTKFLIWFLENYPESKEVIKKDHEFQLKFK